MEHLDMRGMDFGQIANQAGQGLEKQQGRIPGFPKIQIPPDILRRVPGLVAKEILGREQKLRGDQVARVEGIVRKRGFHEGYKGKGAAGDKDEVQDKVVLYTAMILADRIGALPRVQLAYEKAKKQGDAEKRFVLPHWVRPGDFYKQLGKDLPAAPVGGIDVAQVVKRLVVFDQKKGGMTLPQLVRVMRDVYMNLSEYPETAQVAKTLVRKAFALKTGEKQMVYQKDLGIGSADALIKHWNTQEAEYIESPITGPLTLRMSYNKIISAIERSGVYGFTTIDELREGPVGKMLRGALDLLRPKGKSQKAESVYPPFELYRRLLADTDYRISKGGETGLKFADSLLATADLVFPKNARERFTSRLDLRIKPETVLKKLASAQLNILDSEIKASLAIQPSANNVMEVNAECGLYTAPNQAPEQGVKVKSGQHLYVTRDAMEEAVNGWVRVQLGSRSWYIHESRLKSFEKK